MNVHRARLNRSDFQSFGVYRKDARIDQLATGSRRTPTLTQVRPMSKRTSIYALAAVAALGITALATSSASAFGGHGPGGMHGPMGGSVKPPGPMGLIIKPNKPVV